MSQYPFNFKIYLTYTLEENTVIISYRVENADIKVIYFQLGSHPGLKCPLNDTLDFSDYEVTFDKAVTSERYYFNGENKVLSNKKGAGFNGDLYKSLNHKDFYEGAQVFKDVQADSFMLGTSKDKAYVKITAHNFTNLILWQAKDAPFICIEPVNGIADEDIYQGTLANKESILSLAAEEVLSADLFIEIG